MLEFDTDTRSALQESLKRYMLENFDEDMGDLKSQLLLDFIVEEIGPSIYNKAIQDAQSYFIEKTTDLEATCYLPPGDYWQNHER